MLAQTSTVDHIRIPHRLNRVPEERNRLHRLFDGGRQNLRVGVITLRAGQFQLKSQPTGRLDPGVGHIVAVPHPGDFQLGDLALLLLHGHDVA